MLLEKHDERWEADSYNVTTVQIATELHHIVAVEDGGTDDLINLMPLCRMCHKEYTSSQTIERNQLWAEISIDDKGELSTRYKGEKSSTEKPIIFNSSRPTKFLIETKMGSIIRGVLLPDNPIEIISKGDIDKAEMNCGDGSSIKDILSIK